MEWRIIMDNHRTEFETGELYIVRPSIVINDTSTYSTSLIRDELLISEFYFYDRPTLLNRLRYQLKREKFLRLHERNQNVVIHQVDFQSNVLDVSFATKEIAGFRDCFSGEFYYNGLANHLCEGEKCVGICRDDHVLLFQYLVFKFAKSHNCDEEIQQLILSLKPYFTIQELRDILQEIKELAGTLLKTDSKKFSLVRKRTEPIFSDIK